MGAYRGGISRFDGDRLTVLELSFEHLNLLLQGVPFDGQLLVLPRQALVVLVESA